MIKAVFRSVDGIYTGFTVSGHAGGAEYGKDIVCAAVSSAVMLTVNSVLEFLSGVPDGKDKAKVRVTGDKVGLIIPDEDPDYTAGKLIYLLRAHLKAIAVREGRGKIQLGFISVNKMPSNNN